MLEQKTGSKSAADGLVNSIVYKKPFGERAMLDTEIWKNNPDDWDKARVAAGEMLAKGASDRARPQRAADPSRRRGARTD
jgi:hypothetical protein